MKFIKIIFLSVLLLSTGAQASITCGIIATGIKPGDFFGGTIETSTINVKDYQACIDASIVILNKSHYVEQKIRRRGGYSGPGTVKIDYKPSAVEVTINQKPIPSDKINKAIEQSPCLVIADEFQLVEDSHYYGEIERKDCGS